MKISRIIVQAVYKQGYFYSLFFFLETPLAPEALPTRPHIPNPPGGPMNVGLSPGFVPLETSAVLEQVLQQVIQEGVGEVLRWDDKWNQSPKKGMMSSYSLSEHQRTVSQEAGSAAWRLGFTKEAVLRVRFAAACHDIGKIQNPEMFRKDGGFTDLEHARKNEHARHSYRWYVERTKELTVAFPTICDNIRGVALLVRFHHRPWRLRKAASQFNDALIARLEQEVTLLHVADMYHALRERRGSRHSMSAEEAYVLSRGKISEIRREHIRSYAALCLEVRADSQILYLPSTHLAV